MSNKSMFYGAAPTIFEKARELRTNMTFHEKLLWNKLKANQLLGLRFKAQHPIFKYIVDFYCHQLKLVIEIDGDNHFEINQAEYDEGRTADLKGLGLDVVRFTNESVQNNIDEVLSEIESICAKRKHL